MKQETYLTLQLANIDNAISLGQLAMDSARTLQELSKTQDEMKANDDFTKDSLRYYSFSDALKTIEGMPIKLKDFKNQLIEIKIANDKMLLEGGFIPSIDKEIAEVFLSHTLCKMNATDPETVVAIQDAIAVLEKMKAELQAMQ